MNLAGKVLVQWTRSNPLGWEAFPAHAWRAQPRKPSPRAGRGPLGGNFEPLDDKLGWPHRVNVQGMHATGDHYCVEWVGAIGERERWLDDEMQRLTRERHGMVSVGRDGKEHRRTSRPMLVRPSGPFTRLVAWFDDPEDYPPDQHYAHVLDFYAPGPNSRTEHAMNTRIYRAIYCAPKAFEMWTQHPIQTTGGEVPILRLSDWNKPSEDLTRHGVWVTNEENDQHESLIGVKRELLSSDELDRRRVPWMNWIDV